MTTLIPSPFLKFLRPVDLYQRIGLGLVAFGFFILLGTIAVAPNVATLNCHRSTDYYSVCTLRNMSLLGLPVRHVDLDPLEGAQSFPSDGMPGWTNQVMLYQHGKSIPFSLFSNDRESVKRSVTQINTFLGNPEIPKFRYALLVPSPVLLTVLLGALSFLGLGLTLLRTR